MIDRPPSEYFSKRGYFWIGYMAGMASALVLVIAVELFKRALD